MKTNTSCPKCNAEMERGFIFEKSMNDYRPEIWVQGEPQTSWRTTTDVHGQVKRLVETQRCTQCGFLESYAIKEIDLDNIGRIEKK